MSAKTASITFARCTALLAGISSLATAAAAQQLAPQEAQVASRMQTAERVEVVPMSVIETPTGAAPIYRRDNGAPGIRAHYHPNYYGAFVLDPDGNKIEVLTFPRD